MTVTPRYTPALALLLLSPAIGEVLFGAVPLSLLPFGLVGLIGLYGGGALLVRETVRRRRLPGYWLVLLGAAYGLFEEGSVVQSLFDQHFRGLDFLGYYGHWIGVNWVWGLFIVPYHAVFSIAVPILLTEVMFEDCRRAPWLGPAGLAGAAAVFAANAVLLAILHTGLFTSRAPATSRTANVAALLIVTAIAGAAFAVAPTAIDGRLERRRILTPRRLRFIGLASGLAWFVGFRVVVIGTGTLMTAPLALAAGSAIACAIAIAIWYAAAPEALRSSEETYALVAGALPTCWLMGFVIAAVSGGSPAINLAGHVVFGAVLFWSLRRVHLRIRPALATAP